MVISVKSFQLLKKLCISSKTVRERSYRKGRRDISSNGKTYSFKETACSRGSSLMSGVSLIGENTSRDFVNLLLTKKHIHFYFCKLCSTDAT